MLHPVCAEEQDEQLGQQKLASRLECVWGWVGGWVGQDVGFQKTSNRAIRPEPGSLID